MLEKLNETYGITLSIHSERKLSGIPLYLLAGRSLYEVQYEGLTFLLVCISDADRFGSVALSKQLSIYQEAAGLPVAYAFQKLTHAQRAALISRQIPFISEPDQIFLPFVGMMLRSGLKQKPQPQIEKMMPATQCLFLHLVYNGKQGCLKKDAADRLGLTKTSISRASEQLVAMQLIREEKHGREIQMFPVLSGRAAFTLAKPYLVNPIQKTMFAKLDAAMHNLVCAGESALSARTMLSRPRIPVFAVDRRADMVGQLQEIDPKWETDAEVCMIEIWKYRPELFSAEGVIDPISLAMSLEQQEDERIEGALEEYMENYKW